MVQNKHSHFKGERIGKEKGSIRTKQDQHLEGKTVNPVALFLAWGTHWIMMWTPMDVGNPAPKPCCCSSHDLFLGLSLFIVCSSPLQRLHIPRIAKLLGVPLQFKIHLYTSCIALSRIACRDTATATCCPVSQAFPQYLDGSLYDVITLAYLQN
jgi:hypothetical protein